MEGSAPKRFRLGTHRVRPPEETWEALRGVLPRVGVTRVADVTGLDRIGIPVWQAVRPASRSLSVSQGKGATPAAARASAVMESIELWHAEDLSHLSRVVLSPREMRYDNPIPLSSLRWTFQPPEVAAVPIPWVRARCLGGGPDGWLPLDMLELDFTEPAALPLRLFHRTSNGLASGNCFEEAVLHGACELAERHAVRLAGEDPARKVPLREDSVDVPWLREPLDRIRAAGCKLALWDVTGGLGLPVFLVDLAAPDIPNVWRGSGCHPDPAVALSRALTEAAQSRLTYISGARDDLPFFGGEDLAQRLFEDFTEPAGGRTLADLPDLSTASVATDLDVVTDHLAAQGFEAYWVDLTRPEIGVPVVTVFIPGLKDKPHG
ncbi:MAG TPA: YcaO-like family protein [Thermoanaerobaculia bacterium]|nr:YcaO-like family protein [Thermoanaerobaculia bacterium]